MRMAGVCCLVAVGVNPEGRREVLGLELASAEDGPGWLGFLRGLLARGLSGIQLVISDAHPGLVEAARSVLAGAAWQRSSVDTPSGREPLACHPRRRERALAA
jgi:transposase-like protein